MYLLLYFHIQIFLKWQFLILSLLVFYSFPYFASKDLFNIFTLLTNVFKSIFSSYYHRANFCKLILTSNRINFTINFLANKVNFLSWSIVIIHLFFKS